MVNNLLQPRIDDIFEYPSYDGDAGTLYINTKLYIKLIKKIEKNKSNTSYLLYKGLRRMVYWTEDGWAEFKIKVKIDGINYTKHIVINSLKFYENDGENDDEETDYVIKLCKKIFGEDVMEFK